MEHGQRGHTHSLPIIYHHFHMTAGELRSCNKTYTACKTVTLWPPKIGKLCQPLAQEREMWPSLIASSSVLPSPRRGHPDPQCYPITLLSYSAFGSLLLGLSDFDVSMKELMVPLLCRLWLSFFFFFSLNNVFSRCIHIDLCSHNTLISCHC